MCPEVSKEAPKQDATDKMKEVMPDKQKAARDKAKQEIDEMMKAAAKAGEGLKKK